MLGTRIRDLRVKMGMTQKQLADSIEATQATISQYESGVRLPSPFLRRRLEEKLGVSLEQIARPSLDGSTDHVKELTAIARGLPDEYLVVLLELARVLRSREQALQSSDIRELDTTAIDVSIEPEK